MDILYAEWKFGISIALENHPAAGIDWNLTREELSISSERDDEELLLELARLCTEVAEQLPANGRYSPASYASTAAEKLSRKARSSG